MIWAWMRKNLFNGPGNTLLTLITAYLLFVLGRSVLLWAFHEARWAVVPNNFRLFMVGPYPPGEVWRVWVALAVFLFAVGYSIGAVAGYARRALALGAVLSLLVYALAWPALLPGSRMGLFAALLALFLAWLLGAGLGPRRARRLGVWVWLVGLFIALEVLAGVPSNRWGGLLLTVVATIFAVVLAFPLGLLLALGRTSRMPVISLLSTLYIELVRGVPLVTVLFLAWIMVPLFVPENFRVPQLVRGIAGFVLFAAAYLAEYVRGGLQGVPKGQWEAAWALGLSGFHTVVFVILPQAIRAVIPALIGQAIAIFKDTSLFIIIGIMDLLSMAQAVLSNPKYLGLEREVYLFVMFVYFLGAATLSYLSRRLERAMGLGSR